MGRIPHHLSYEGDGSDLLAVVEHCCGREAMERLAFKVGGGRVTVPREPREHHVLSLILGVEGTRKVVAIFGWGEVEVPMGPAALHERLRTAAEALIKSGKSGPEVARALGVSQRTVTRYRRRMKAGKA